MAKAHRGSGGGGVAAACVGTTCHQGLVIAEILSVELMEDRVRELRMLGPLLLRLSVALSLGPITVEKTVPRRGSHVATWVPPERRELLWDAQERWLWCRVEDGSEFSGESKCAGEGRIDLFALAAGAGRSPITEPICVDLYVPAEDGDDEEDGSASEGSSVASTPRVSPSSSSLGGRSAHPPNGSFLAPPPHGGALPPWPVWRPPLPDDGGGGGTAPPSISDDEEDLSGPARGLCCGLARLRLTLIDMSGMVASQERKAIGDVPPPRRNGGSNRWAL